MGRTHRCLLARGASLITLIPLSHFYDCTAALQYNDFKMGGGLLLPHNNLLSEPEQMLVALH